jgi:NAD(P)-dependent dehydrogenase (short-subunit alcohol dehydrogenase family)
VIVDISQATLGEGKKIVESYGTKCLAAQADVTKEENVEKAVAAAVEEFGRIDYAA